MSNLPSPEDLMRRACEVRDEDQQQANTARRVGALLADLVTTVSSALPLTSWRVTRSKASVAVEYAVLPADGGAAVTMRVELPAATDGAAGVMSAAQVQALDCLPALLRGRDAANSAYTDPFIWLGEYSAATHGADYLKQFNDALDALCGEEGDDAGARRWTGRVRATVDGRNVEIHQYVTHFARRVFTQTIEGNVAVGEDGRIVLLPAGNYASLTRSCDGGEWTSWQVAQLPAEDLSRRAYLTDDAFVSEEEILIRMKNFVTGRQDGALILPGATNTEAGLMTAADKVKVNDIPQPQVSSEGSGKAFVYSMSDTNDARCVMTMRNTDIFQNAGKLHFRRGYWSTAAEGGKYITREIPAATTNSDGVMPKEVFARLGTGASIREGTPTASQVPVVYPDWAAGGTRSFTLGAATSARAGLMTAADKRLLGSIVHLGAFASKDAACDYAARAEVAGNKQAALLLFTATGATGAQLGGRICQMVNGENVAMQILMWDKRQYRRNVTGATGRAGDSTNAFPWEETAPHKLDYDPAAHRLSMLSYENGPVGSVTLPQSTTAQDGLMTAADKRRLAETQNLVPEVAAFVENVAIETIGVTGSGRIVFDTGRQRFLFNKQMKYYFSIPPAMDPGSVFSSPRTGQLYLRTGEQEGLYRWNGTTLESVAAAQTTSPVPIAVGYDEGRLRVYGHEELLEQGYRPCIFRRKKCKRDYRSRPDVAEEEEYREWKLKKGWICYGSPAAVRIAEDGTVEFSTAPLPKLKISPESLGYTYSAVPRGSLIRVVTEENGNIYVRWGGKVWMTEPDESGTIKYRILKFPFALGFVREKGYNEAITPADLVSTLAEFSINVQWRGYGYDEDGVKVAFSK